MSTAFFLKIAIPLSLLLLAALLFHVESRRPPRHLNPRQAAMVESLHTAVLTGKEQLK